MKSIRDIFNQNITLLGYIDRAVVLFRQGRYDEALGMVAESGPGLQDLYTTILEQPEYFKGISEYDVATMVNAILEAKRSRDYVLLADMYELQLSGFICDIQEWIIASEDFFNYDTTVYNRHIRSLEQKLALGMETCCGPDVSPDEIERLRVNRNAELESPLSPEFLLENGYSVEYTSCGLMTLRAPLASGESIYLHTNGNIMRESFELADRWRDRDATHYIMFGFGLGYHVRELLDLEKFAHVTVFESDINVLKLYAAFTDGTLLEERRLTIVYDPDRTLVEKRLLRLRPDEKPCVHYPSMRRQSSGKMLLAIAPFADIVERC